MLIFLATIAYILIILIFACLMRLLGATPSEAISLGLVWMIMLIPVTLYGIVYLLKMFKGMLARIQPWCNIFPF